MKVRGRAQKGRDTWENGELQTNGEEQGRPERQRKIASVQEKEGERWDRGRE